MSELCKHLWPKVDEDDPKRCPYCEIVRLREQLDDRQSRLVGVLERLSGLATVDMTVVCDAFRDAGFNIDEKD